jgi:hypothetical protein
MQTYLGDCEELNLKTYHSNKDYVWRVLKPSKRCNLIYPFAANFAQASFNVTVLLKIN